MHVVISFAPRIMAPQVFSHGRPGRRTAVDDFLTPLLSKVKGRSHPRHVSLRAPAATRTGRGFLCRRTFFRVEMVMAPILTCARYFKLC